MIIGYTCGVFDLIHVGHINLLKNAKSLCDKLIIGLSTDECIKYKLKNSVINYEDRKKILESIKYVDCVIPQINTDKFEAWKQIKYNILFVGNDWYNTPKWNTISVSGYHIREAGSTAVEEVALTLANGIFYAEEAVKAGLDIDDFAPRMSFFFGCHNDFFEEIAKFRAARELWYELVNERFNPKNPKSSQLRFHTQTAGVTLTAQQPINNAVRVSYQALSAVLGGTQSLHTNSYDEAIGLPTNESVKIALRTQQIIALETGVADVVDPLAGSYLVEELTTKIKNKSYEMILELEDKGGVLNCLKSGIQQRMIHESAWKEIKDTEAKDLLVVGVNTNIEESDNMNLGLKIDSNNESMQISKLNSYRTSRDNTLVSEKLDKLKIVCQGDDNVMPPLIDALKSGATVGEVNGIMREVFGTWISPSGV